MAWTKLEVTLSEGLLARLEAAAGSQNKTLNLFTQEALFTYVEDVEDGVAGNIALTNDGLIHLATEGGLPIGVDDSVYEDSRKTA